MLEAVNSVLQSTTFVRASAEQVAASESFAANPDRVQKAPQAPYVSPYIYLDINYDKAVIQLRNGETGDVEGQFPSESSLEFQARNAARREAAVQPAPDLSANNEAARVSFSASEIASSTAGESSSSSPSVPTQQQVAAFQAAARGGNTNAGNVTLFA